MHKKSCSIPLKINLKVFNAKLAFKASEKLVEFRRHLCAKSSSSDVTNQRLTTPHSKEAPALIENWFKCAFCNYKCPREHFESLQRHVAVKHNGLDAKCKFCGCDTANKVELQRHLRAEHPTQYYTRGADTVLTCNQCPYSTNLQVRLTNHIHRKHSGAKPRKKYQCTYCAHKLATKYELTLHLTRKHKESGGKWYNCDHCDYKTLGGTFCLKFHMLSKHTKAEDIKWLQCCSCDYKAMTQGLLKQHTRKKHGARETKWHPCRLCDAKFKLNASLKAHIFHKHPAEPCGEVYKCLYCDFKHVHRGDVNAHMKYKHVESPVQCAYCDVVCKNDAAYKKHQWSAKHLATK